MGRAPELDGLLDEGQEVADLAAGGGVDPFPPDVGGVGVGWGEGDRLVEPPAAEQQRHLASSSTLVSLSPRARSVTVGVTTWRSLWSSSQRTPSEPGASRLTTPTGGPQVSRSRTPRADSGASATKDRISPGGSGFAPSSSDDGPRPAG